MKLIKLLIVCCLVGACSEKEVRTLQIVSNGRELYTTHCSNCHHTDGEGLKGVIPSLKRSDYLLSHSHALPCLIRNGTKEMAAGGNNGYSMKMPGNKVLSDREIIFICNYVLFTFSDSAQLFNMDSIFFDEVFKSCDSISSKL